MPNRLSHENSPYLLQHQNNPVDWYPWGPEALEKARTENRPIFLSIGYAACHWCHVMEHESFEDANTADFMNQHFVNIKVDREERPEIDHIYMNAVVALTGQGGWPLSAFLTPKGKPFWGGTYFPPTRRHNMPSFMEVLNHIANAWEQRPDELLAAGDQLTEHIIAQSSVNNGQSDLDTDILDRASNKLIASYDWRHGGWGQAPKFPQPMALLFLLRQASAGNKHALAVSEHALLAMAQGGMYDLIGGGFARYSVDNHWLVPHFEKMLYDNAQLARAYLHAYLLTRNPFYKRICEETLDFVLREMTNPQGGFYSSLDADSEGVEGKFYMWSLEEVQGLVPDKQEFELVQKAYRLTEDGNFEGKNILRRLHSYQELAEIFSSDTAIIAKELRSLNQRLLAARDKRIRPATDDKVITAWNGMMLTTFAEAARYLQRIDYLQAAIKNADFLLSHLWNNGTLHRSWRAHQAKHNGYLADYSSIVLGLLALYQSDPNTRWFAAANEITKVLVSQFADPAGGFFDTRDDHEILITRPKDLQDNATPSGNSQAANALVQMAAFTGEHEWHEKTKFLISNLQEAFKKYPIAFSNWLCAIDFDIRPVQEVAIVGDPAATETQDLLDVLWAEYRANTILARSPYPPPPESPPLLLNRPQLDGKATAFVCQNFTCQSPVTSAEAFKAQLAR